MFIVREYAACLLVALLLAALLVAGCGIFLAFKAGYRIAARTLVRAHKFTTATLERTRAELPVRGAAPATPLPGGME
jgi:hypothetical protein